GFVWTDMGGGVSNDMSGAVAVQPDGRIVVAGMCEMGATGDDACVARYEPDGDLDPTFGGDGMVTMALAPGANRDMFWRVRLQPDGKIVLGGECTMAANDMELCV